MNQTFSRLTPYLLLVLLLGLRIIFPGFSDNLTLKVFDAYQKLKPRPWTVHPVIIADIDDESLAQYGQWPWPRTRLADLTHKLHEAGARVIAFDIVFSEPDRTSPSQVSGLWPDKPELAALLKGMPDHDLLLARAFEKSNIVTAFGLTPQPGSPDLPAIKSSLAYAGANPADFLPEFQGSVNNLEIFDAAANGSGSFTIIPDEDGSIRRPPLFYRLKDGLFPSLALEAVRLFEGEKTYKVKMAGGSGEINFGEKTGWTKVQIGRHVIPTDSAGRIWLYDSGYRPERFLPAWKILSGEVTAPQMKEKIVFIGTSAAGLKDIRRTPLNPAAAGVEIHAQITEQIIAGQFLKRPDWATGAEFSYFFILSLFLIILLPKLGAAKCAAVSSLAVMAAFISSWLAFDRAGFLFDPFWPSLGVLILYLGISLLNFIRTENEKREVRAAFSRYLSPALVERLAQHPEQLSLGGEMKPMTVLFADIRDFTHISEKFTAGELTHFMNRFLTPMTEIILKHGGTIDKYMGDCIMAFWNAPLDDSDHANHACQAALEMHTRLRSWNNEMEREIHGSGKPFTPISIGIGINTGICCVGNMGSEQRFDYSVLGDEVNLASRLEGMCKLFGVETVVGAGTFEAADQSAFLELDRIQVKGKSVAVTVFTLLGGKTISASQDFQTIKARHDEMLASYRARRWDYASATVEELLAKNPLDGRLRNAYLLYQKRLERFKVSPPETQWNGVFTALEK